MFLKCFKNFFFPLSCSQGSGPSSIFLSFSSFQSTSKYFNILFVYLRKTTNSQVYTENLLSLNSRKTPSDPQDQVIRANKFLFVPYAMKQPKLLIGKEHTHMYTKALFLSNNIFSSLSNNCELNIAYSSISLLISFDCYNKSYI